MPIYILRRVNSSQDTEWSLDVPVPDEVRRASG
jgi:hypothetical protein